MAAREPDDLDDVAGRPWPEHRPWRMVDDPSDIAPGGSEGSGIERKLAIQRRELAKSRLG